MYLIEKRVQILFFIGFLFLGQINIFAGDTEVENWTFVGAQTMLGKSELSFHNANFFKAEESWFLNHTQITLDFATHKNLFWGIGYKQEYVDFSDRWRKEYRPFFRVFYSKNLGDFQLLDINQYELRFMDDELINRYRNAIILKLNKFEKVEPYIRTEFFILAKGFDHYRQRTLLGALVPIKNITANIFLGHQYDEILKGEWTNKFMLGTGLSYSF